MFRYPGFEYISYSEMPGQFRYDIAAVQKKFVFRMWWLYIIIITQGNTRQYFN